MSSAQEKLRGRRGIGSSARLESSRGTSPSVGLGSARCGTARSCVGAVGRVFGPAHALGLVRFGSAYEGPPGHVHGGFVAAAFDEVLGYVQSLGGRPGMTGTLTVRYRSPTPLYTELRFEA